jgi:hypothetical protein
VKKFEETGSMIDNQKGVVGRKRSVRTPENTVHVYEVLTVVQANLSNGCLNSWI